MSDARAGQAVDQPTFWRERGGEAWTANIETVERQIAGLSEILLERAAPAPGESVLDVGCGGGVTSKALADAVGASGHVLGVDVSDRILAVARERYAGVANLEFRTGDAETMSLPARKFDLVLSRFGVMFFEDPIAAFSNLRGALRGDGRLVFMCWRGPEENPWMSVPAAAAFSVLEPPPPPDPAAPGPFAFADAERLRHILGRAGFVEVALEPIDEAVNLGSIEQSIRLMSELGPAAALLAEAGEVDRARAIEAIRAALARYETADGLKLPSATWIVAATPS